MGKPKKGKSKKALTIEEKKKLLQTFWSDFQSQCEEFENHMNSICEETCAKIRKMYADKLQKLPENIRNMTLTEYIEMITQSERMELPQQKQTEELSHSVSKILSQYEKSVLISEKKKTEKKKNKERKRSMSVSICSAGKPLFPNKPSISRVMSESCLNTPFRKVSAATAFVVTPKFNPKIPISKACMRRPRAGELLMSLSGSPLHNFVDDIPEKPGVAVSLGGGKVIKITEDTEITKLDDDFLNKLDEETKTTLANVKEKLDKIFKA